MGSIEQEIEYWNVQKNTLDVRNLNLQIKIDQIKHDLKVAKDRLKELRKTKEQNKNMMIICDLNVKHMLGQLEVGYE